MHKIALIIPAYNESLYIIKTLDSLANQTYQYFEVIVVDDNSTDDTAFLVDEFSKKHANFKLVKNKSEASHAPGTKVINAFLEGLKHSDLSADYVAKFDADLIFPPQYLDKIIKHFEKNERIGLIGGQAYIYRDEAWILENLTNHDHVRGALKCYRKEALEQIGGLKPVMGWDTLDELLLKYHGWQVLVDTNLKVKHLKPTGFLYKPQHSINQGVAFYQLGYGFVLTLIASTKLAFKKKRLGYLLYYLRGYMRAFFEKKPKFVTAKQEKFIRNHRWKHIYDKFF